MVTIEVISQSLNGSKIQLGVRFNDTEQLVTFNANEFTEELVTNKLKQLAQPFQEADDKSAELNMVGTLIEVN